MYLKHYLTKYNKAVVFSKQYR